MRQYDREDIEKLEGGFEGWYTPHMRMLAARLSREEIEKRLGITSAEASKAAGQHLAAIRATGSMTSQSQRRAQTGNVVRAAGQEALNLRCALEIYELFPERTKGDA